MELMNLYNKSLALQNGALKFHRCCLESAEQLLNIIIQASPKKSLQSMMSEYKAENVNFVFHYKKEDSTVAFETTKRGTSFGVFPVDFSGFLEYAEKYHIKINEITFDLNKEIFTFSLESLKECTITYDDYVMFENMITSSDVMSLGEDSCYHDNKFKGTFYMRIPLTAIS